MYRMLEIKSKNREEEIYEILEQITFLKNRRIEHLEMTLKHSSKTDDSEQSQQECNRELKGLNIEQNPSFQTEK